MGAACSLMETLPYFMLLLKNNILLCSIISTGSFAHLDLSHIEHRIHSNQAIELLNFPLGNNDTFTSVRILMVESGTSLTFFTPHSKYFNETERYFQRNSNSKTGVPYTIDGIENRTNKKSLGHFVIMSPPVPPASVWVRDSTAYGYAISIQFFKHNSTFK